MGIYLGGLGVVVFVGWCCLAMSGRQDADEALRNGVELIADPLRPVAAPAPLAGHRTTPRNDA